MVLQPALLHATFQAIEQYRADFIGSMYQRLFVLYSDVAHFFEYTCMEEQQQKLLMMLAFILENIDNPEQLARPLQRLGQIHVHYGIQRADFDKVGVALIETFAEYLDERWTPEHAAAWTTAYRFITQLMFDEPGSAA